MPDMPDYLNPHRIYTDGRIDNAISNDTDLGGQRMTITESTALIRANLPEQLRDNLELCEIKQIDLERKIDSFKDACGRYLRGEYIPSLPVAVAMAKTLGVTLDRLCTGED